MTGAPLNAAARELKALEAEAPPGMQGGGGQADGAPTDAALDTREEQALLNHRLNLRQELLQGQAYRKRRMLPGGRADGTTGGGGGGGGGGDGGREEWPSKSDQKRARSRGLWGSRAPAPGSGPGPGPGPGPGSGSGSREAAPPPLPSGSGRPASGGSAPRVVFS